MPKVVELQKHRLHKLEQEAIGLADADGGLTKRKETGRLVGELSRDDQETLLMFLLDKMLDSSAPDDGRVSLRISVLGELMAKRDGEDVDAFEEALEMARVLGRDGR